MTWIRNVVKTNRKEVGRFCSGEANDHWISISSRLGPCAAPPSLKTPTQGIKIERASALYDDPFGVRPSSGSGNNARQMKLVRVDRTTMQLTMDLALLQESWLVIYPRKAPGSSSSLLSFSSDLLVSVSGYKKNRKAACFDLVQSPNAADICSFED